MRRIGRVEDKQAHGSERGRLRATLDRLRGRGIEPEPAKVEVDAVRRAMRTRTRAAVATRRRAFQGVVSIPGIVLLHQINVEPNRPTRDQPRKRRRVHRTPKPGQRRAARRRDGSR
jgi:hypothetical protein